MLPSFLLSLREGLEAALIIGIVFGALRKIRRTDLAPVLWIGAGVAAVVSIAVAVLLTLLGLEMQDPGEAIFEGLTMLFAAGILTGMIMWMSRQSRTLKTSLENGVNLAAASGGKQALFWLAFIAVVREGIELSLFLTAAVFASDAIQTVSGALLGLFTAALLGWSLFASTVRLDLRRFFQVTGVLLVLFAAGLVGHAVHEFNDAGWIPVIIEHVWNLNNVISETSFIGTILKTLFGYNASPSLTESIGYGVYLVTVTLGVLISNFKLEKSTVQSQA